MSYSPFSRRIIPLAWGATFLLAAILLVLTLTPQDMPGSGVGRDKIYHMIGFGSLAFPLCLAYPHRSVAVVIGVIAFGGTIELVQPYVGREGEWADLLADALGAVLAGALAVTLVRAGRRWWPRSA